MAGFESNLYVGNVGQDPTFKYTQGGTPVASFSIAVNKTWTDKTSGDKKEKTKWIRVTAWRQLAETVQAHVHKGMQVLVTGEIDTSAYLDQQGQPQSSLELTAAEIRFMGTRQDSAGGDFAPPPDNQGEIPF